MSPAIAEVTDALATDLSQKSQLGHLNQELLNELIAVQKEITQHSEAWTKNKLKAGEILLQLRQGVPHGEWEPQLKHICETAGIGRSTAHRYMDLAEGKKVAMDTQTSLHGYALDELRSALQKAVRLGDEHLAMQCAVELDLSGKTQWIWDRLHIFASEDIGLAAMGLHQEIKDLYEEAKKRRGNPMTGDFPHRLFLIHAVLLCVRVQKSRLTDHALIAYYNSQKPILIPEDCTAGVYDQQESIEIPDVAIDKHTAQGSRKLGRRGAAGINHFFDFGANLKNESPAIDDPYKESARQALLRKGAA